MAPWLPPIVVYCPPAQQCSAVAPPAPPRPHPRPRPVPPPCRCPPFSPPPPHPPRASPAIRVCGGEGGALTGGALWVPCSWAGGGALPSLALWARPRAPYLGASPGLSLQGRARRWRGAPGIARERPVRRAPAGRNATPLCARRTTCSTVRHERPTIQRDARPRHPGLCVLHGRQGGCAAGGSLVRRFSALHRPAAAVA